MGIVLTTPLRRSVKDEFQSEPTFPSLGLASIGAVLEEEGYEVQVIHPYIEKLTFSQLCQKIEQAKPDLLGISAFTEEMLDAGELSAEIKMRLPRTVIALGGPHASALPERTLREFSGFDVIVIGEGEQTCLRLIETIRCGKSWHEINGIAFRENGEIRRTAPVKLIPDLDMLPFPAWHLFPIEKYRLLDPSGFAIKGLMMPVEGARGCPFGCIFCYRVFGRKVRFKSAQRIADEIEYVVDRFGARRIHFTEGTFGVNREHAQKTCDELIRRGLNKRIEWETGDRVDRVDLPLLKKMKEAGCVEIGYGIESGNQEILRRAGKGTTLRQIHDAIHNTKKVGIKAAGCFILGLPYETEETVKATIAMASELDLDIANLAILVPFPGTKVAEMARKGEGGLRLLSEDWSEYGKQLGKTLELENIPREKLLALQRQAYRAVYLDRGNIWKTLSIVRKIGLRKSLRLMLRYLGWSKT